MNIPKFQDKIICNKVKDNNNWVHKFKICFQKWNKYIAATVAIILFGVLVAVVVYDIWSSPAFSNQTAETQRNTKTSRNNPCTFSPSSCQIECLNIPDDQSVEEHVNKLEITCSELKLRIESRCRSGCVLKVGWLQSTRNYIRELSINWNLVDIEDGAFHMFNSLRTLTFEDSRISYLRKNTFRGLLLISFSFRYIEQTLITIDEGLLENMSGLEVLQFSNCRFEAESIRNLTSTAGAILGSLKIIDFQYNFIRDIPANAFENANSLSSLFLSHSQLQNVDVKAFTGLNGLKLLHLNNNFLTTLKSGTFPTAVMATIENLHLYNNRWNCTCELKWLKDLYLSSDAFDKSKPLICHEGQKPFDKVIFCNDTNTETTTEISSITTESPGKRLLQINCTDLKANQIIVSRTVGRDYVHTQILEIQDSCLKMDFFELEPDPLIVQIEISGDITNYHLLWFNSHSINETDCITNLSSNIFLDKLKRNNTYTVCMIYRGNTSVTPYDCFGFRVRAAWPFRCFIINKWIELVISFAVGIPLIVGAISAFMMFYCVRQNPKLIKGNKRVIIVGSKTTDAIIMPKDYDRPAYVPPSVDSYAHSLAPTYLTPNYHPYAKVRYNYRPPFLRSVSEESVFTNSYINPQVPTPYELNTRRSNVRNRPKLDDIIRNENHYEVPPPLPPLNKCQNHKLPTEENPYSSV